MKLWIILAGICSSVAAYGAIKSPFDHCVDSLHKRGGLSIRQAQELCLKKPEPQSLSCQNKLFLRHFVSPLEAYGQCTADSSIAGAGTVSGYGGFFQKEPMDSRKKTICSVTVNSEEERDLFRRHYGAQNYNFIELLPQREQGRFIVRDGRWLTQACQNKIRCDILVLSGHFAESFLGESGFEISAEDLHAAACQENCADFFSSVQEVYLFGCNTLASKKPDTRSINQYVKILTEDGLGPHKAQRVAARRYTEYNFDYLTEMRALFLNAENIFGYPSLGPSGKSVAGTLRSYLQARINSQKSLSEAFQGTLAKTGMVRTSGLKNNLCESRNSVLQNLTTFSAIQQFVRAYGASLPVPAADVLEESFAVGQITREQHQELMMDLQAALAKIPARERSIRVCPLLLAQHKSYLPSDISCEKNTRWLRGL